MNLYVTRHGQTDWNVQKKVMGRCDESLNAKGVEQAEEMKLVFAFESTGTDKVISQV